MIAALSALFLVAGVLATPIDTSKINLVARDWDDYTADVTIHESCNSTQRRMLEKALA